MAEQQTEKTDPQPQQNETSQSDVTPLSATPSGGVMAKIQNFMTLLSGQPLGSNVGGLTMYNGQLPQVKGNLKNALNGLFGCDVAQYLYDPRICGACGLSAPAPPAIKNQMSTFKAGGKTWTLHKRLQGPFTAAINDIVRAGYTLNGSCGSFYYRSIKNKNAKPPIRTSMHGFGVAVDINYDINPFSKSAGGADDLNPGHIRTPNHYVVKRLKQAGFGWGGTYGDLMHFSYPNGA